MSLFMHNQLYNKNLSLQNGSCMPRTFMVITIFFFFAASDFDSTGKSNSGSIEAEETGRAEGIERDAPPRVPRSAAEEGRQMGVRSAWRRRASQLPGLGGGGAPPPPRVVVLTSTGSFGGCPGTLPGLIFGGNNG